GSDAALEWLARLGHEPTIDAPEAGGGPDLSYGARPLRRLVQTAIGDQLARAILAGQVRDGDTVRVDHELGADGLTVSASSGAQAAAPEPAGSAADG
ncbi:hypothetical protein, partial [Streptomyces sp. AC627_RSS907]|uniref:hypothetical protein n=1 Tax=Streptomyces sp. AC627_RSS907 TaxID=2823684 RepID=UPI001C2514F6